jgi:acetamidase/formamidase
VSPPTQVFSGNLDSKEMAAGTTLYLAVLRPGAG